MRILMLVFRFLPMLVNLAENLLGHKSGPQKKEFVLKTIPEIAKGIEDVSTGGQKETWTVINDNMDSISDAIDVTANVLFPPDEDGGG